MLFTNALMTLNTAVVELEDFMGMVRTGRREEGKQEKGVKRGRGFRTKTFTHRSSSTADMRPIATEHCSSHLQMFTHYLNNSARRTHQVLM